MDDLVAVRVRDCPDGSHPEGDSVWITPTLSLKGGFDARVQMGEVFNRLEAALPRGTKEAPPELVLAESKRLEGEWFETFVRHAPRRWNLHDPDGEPWPFDTQRLLDDYELGLPVAEACNARCGDGLLSPLTAGRPVNSPNGHTAGSTSKKRRTKSPRSSSAADGDGLQSVTSP